MPVSALKPSITACGTYSDHAKRLSVESSRADVQPPTAAARAMPRAARIADMRMAVGRLVASVPSTAPPPQELGCRDQQNRHRDEQRRDRVQRRIEPLLDATEYLQRQRARRRAGGEIG